MLFSHNTKYVSLLAPSMSLPDSSVFLLSTVLRSTCTLSSSAALHSDSPFGFECHLQVGPSTLNYFVYACLPRLWACMSLCTVLGTHACYIVNVWLYVCLVVFECGTVCLGSCLSGCSCFNPPPLLFHFPSLCLLLSH